MQIIQLTHQKLRYFTLRNTLETILYALTLLVSIDFPTYVVENINQLVGSDMLSFATDGTISTGFQHETGLRLVS